MKAVVPEIAWHNKNPVFTVDIQSKAEKGFYRAATGGGDSHVVIWHLVLNTATNEVSANFAADLDRHIKAVNVVRFSKHGEYLVSGDDDAIIVLWTLKENVPNLNGSFNDETNKENWVSVKTLRGHKDDIYDICWSPFSNDFLLSGSVDNTAIIWNVEKGTNTGIIGEHNGFVQGVAWDPNGKYLATLSSDRALRIFDATSRKMIAKVTKVKHHKVPGQETEGEDSFIRLFHDDTVKTFFRRLSFSPDGLLLFVPCGIYKEAENEAKLPKDVTYVFLKDKPDRPVLHLPSPDEYTIAVKCCPILFKLNPSQINVFDLPYRMVFAIASRRSIVIYDTQQSVPLGFVTDIHYATLTDLSWSADGRILLASSSDGYCTIIMFGEGELGEPYVCASLKEDLVEVMQVDETLETERQNNTKVESIEPELQTLSINVKPESTNPVEVKSVPAKRIEVKRNPMVISRAEDESKSKLINRIEVKRKPSEVSRPDRSRQQSVPINRIEVKRKRSGTDHAKPEVHAATSTNVNNQPTNESPKEESSKPLIINRLEVRRKPSRSTPTPIKTTISDEKITSKPIDDEKTVNTENESDKVNRSQEPNTNKVDESKNDELKMQVEPVKAEPIEMSHSNGITEPSSVNLPTMQTEPSSSERVSSKIDHKSAEDYTSCEAVPDDSTI